ncbi:hypothetical protein [Streptomyces sp. MBT65]|uniref:hypothetical protein n=1 Tax=Streptomyces sp. MBT65 TaxID=1488395 RepID=UPI001F49164B|nr:hypothetical protein [Streptomyces sp. MBT65]
MWDHQLPVAAPKDGRMHDGWASAACISRREPGVWNVPGPPHHTVEYVPERARVLDAHRADLGRTSGAITRSVHAGPGVVRRPRGDPRRPRRRSADSSTPG